MGFATPPLQEHSPSVHLLTCLCIESWQNLKVAPDLTIRSVSNLLCVNTEYNWWTFREKEWSGSRYQAFTSHRQPCAYRNLSNLNNLNNLNNPSYNIQWSVIGVMVIGVMVTTGDQSGKSTRVTAGAIMVVHVTTYYANNCSSPHFYWCLSILGLARPPLSLQYLFGWMRSGWKREESSARRERNVCRRRMSSICI